MHFKEGWYSNRRDYNKNQRSPLKRFHSEQMFRVRRILIKLYYRLHSDDYWEIMQCIPKYRQERVKMNLFADMSSERYKHILNSFDLYQTIDVNKDIYRIFRKIQLILRSYLSLRAPMHLQSWCGAIALFIFLMSTQIPAIHRAVTAFSMCLSSRLQQDSPQLFCLSRVFLSSLFCISQLHSLWLQK